jgi:quinol monooxygenase YgiN
MILIRITMNALPEKQKEVVQTLLSMMSLMEKEKGCADYSFLCDMTDKDRFYVFEEWESREMLDRHLKSDIFSVLLGTKSLLCEPHGIQICTIRRVEGMNAVLTARGQKYVSV